MKLGPRIIRYLLMGLLVLWFPLVPLLALDAPTQVNDGTGSDIDYSTDTSSYSANWTQIDWSSADPDPVDDNELRYLVDLQKNTLTGWQEVSDGLDKEITAIYSNLPATQTTVNQILEDGVEYRVSVSTYLYRGGAAASEQSDAPSYSNGFLVDVTKPTASIDALSSIQTDTTFLVEW